MTHYFIGRDRSKWRTDVATSGQVLEAGVYPGIDLKYYGNQRQLEYDFIVAPHADPSKIRMRFGGARTMRLNARGELVLGVRSEKVVQHAPRVYQQRGGKRVPVAGHYVIGAGQEVGFEIGDYDHGKPLVIDPVLSYSTFLGDGVDSIAVDSAGNAYVTGSSDSGAVAGVVGTHLSTASYAYVFVAKLNAKGDALSYVTFFGGSSSTNSNGIAVDDAGQAYVTGSTFAPDFPTQNAFQPKLATNGTYPDPNPPGYDLLNEDAYLLKLNAEGSALLYSTYFGGGIDNSWDSGNPSSGRNKGNEDAFGVAVDNAGRAYISGSTNSVDLPVRNAVQSTLSASVLDQPSYAIGDEDAFVAAFDTTAGGDASLLYSTYLGSADLSQAGQPVTNSSANDRGYAIALAGEQKVVVTGVASPFTAPGFPIKNALQSTSGGTYNAFVSEIDISKGGQDSLVFSTYLGGAGGDVGRGITVDKAGNIYVTGTTSSPTLAGKTPVLLGPGGGNDAFVAKLSPTGNALIYLTRFGGSGSDLARSIAVDDAGNAYVSGATSSKDFPLRDPLPNSPVATGFDNYVVELNSTGSAFQYSTRFGIAAGQGDRTVYSPAIAVNSTGDLYVGGTTSSTDFPLVNPIQSTKSFFSVGFVSKLNAVSRGLVVNSTGDLGDSDTTDGACSTGKTLSNGNPECTLRAAIEEANVRPGVDTITFDIPGAPIPTIQITSALPIITKPLTIDGTTQPDGKMVGVSGVGAPAGTDGISISAGDSTLRGLAINGFKRDGILLSLVGNNTIEGCFIGTDVTGTSARGNGQSGIHVLNSPDNLIGGILKEQANVISGNGSAARGGLGVFIDGGASSENKVQGNFIGTDKSGAVAIGNTAEGVAINGAPNNLIGGDDPKVLGTRNIISGNGSASVGAQALEACCGVIVTGATALNNKIQGNFIGTDKSGSRALGNVIGVFVGPDSKEGSGPAPKLSTLIGGPSATPGVAPGNLIAGNSTLGIALSFISGNKVEGNLIGTNAGGSARIGNGKASSVKSSSYSGSGIYLLNSPKNTIGGASQLARNVISGNIDGILILGPKSVENVVEGNFIGTDPSGSRAVGNRDGVVMTFGASNNIIGGTALGAGNVISGNSAAGVRIVADSNDPENNLAPSTTLNRIQGNLIGVDKSGTRAVSNVLGVEVGLVGENTIGGTGHGAGNVISGNTSAGVALLRATGTAVVQGNRIGTSSRGTAAVPNGYGVLVFQSHDNVIGGTVPQARNIISGNRLAGVAIAQVLAGPIPPGVVPFAEGGYSTENEVQGNLIGVGLSGGALGNGSGATVNLGAGVLVCSGASGTKIGGSTLAEGHVISGNNGAGVAVVGASAANPAEGITINNNLIGLTPDGKKALPNTGSGLRLVLAQDNTIGGSSSGNTIAFNGLDGVTVVSGRGNTIVRNSIYSNRKLGINLVGGVENAFGVTFNHSGSASGPNDLQNFPEITDTLQVGGLAIISATLQSRPNTHYLIQFFSNPGRTPSGYGQKYLGFTEVTTDSKGLAMITGRVPLVLTAGQTVSMTATNAQAGTSEFSALPFAISGQITHFVPDPNNPARLVKQGIAGVVVGRLNRSGPSLQIAAAVLTDAQGFYFFKFTPPSIYAILPVKEGPDFHFVFDPAAYVVRLPLPGGRSGAPDAIGVDFVTYTISGLAKDAQGHPLVGVTITLSGAKKRTLVTNSQGRYLFDGLGRGSYTVSAGSGFSPAQKLSLPRPGTIPSGVVDFVRAAPSSQQAASGLLPRASSSLRLALGAR